ncbi:MAG: thioredoxin family protein [Planctomycetes bacterium]|nr:thioredoxin family protein [Planctomycetota bacterium]
MKRKATWYHAGCDVCVSAENSLVAALDAEKLDIEKVDVGRTRARIDEARRRGVKTLPALVVGDDVFHVNFGANLADLG